ncbi:MAG: pyridoxal-phosphate dependent enzyme, partial [Nitrospinae bacterium]|nr:pyridoxal-phosphate dependent enzyme [Nitrospinota bacterium]
REFFQRPLQAFFHLAFVHKREFSITLKDGNSLPFSREKRDNKFWDWFFESPRPVEFTASGLLRIEWEGRPILFRPGTMDFFAFQELFIDDVYDLKSIDRPLGTVIDLGANAGMFALAIAPKAKRLIAVEPVHSPILSGGDPGPHKIQGIGAGFKPDILDMSIVDQILTVSNEEALETGFQLAKQEGILCGISSGAAVYCALKAAKDLGEGKNVVVVLPDTGERYLGGYLFG